MCLNDGRGLVGLAGLLVASVVWCHCSYRGSAGCGVNSMCDEMRMIVGALYVWWACLEVFGGFSV